MTTKENNFIERSLEQFCNLMIEKINSLKPGAQWQKPWFSGSGMLQPVNASGRAYNGMNSIILMMTAEKNGYSLPVWGTYNRLVALGADSKEEKPISVSKGEHGSNVFITTFTVVHKDSKSKIPYEQYMQMDKDEQSLYNVYPRLNVYKVFNVHQTNLKEVRPDLWRKFEEDFSGQLLNNHANSFHYPAFDKMLEEQTWLCPIHMADQDKAYYSISRDKIVIPEYEQFKDGESFYGNCCHEMAHSTGRKENLDRFSDMSDNMFHAKEELIAELTSALVMSKAGIVKHLKDDSAVYIKSWLDTIKERPQFIKNVLMDVKKAAFLIEEKIKQY